MLFTSSKYFSFSFLGDNISLLWQKVVSSPKLKTVTSVYGCNRSIAINSREKRKEDLLLSNCEPFIVLYTGVHRPYRTCPACIIIVIIIYDKNLKCTKLQMISSVKKVKKFPHAIYS